MIDSPWLASAFNAGHALRLSPSFGATYSGHFPPAPGFPCGVTCPILRLNVTRFTNDNPKSRVKMIRFSITFMRVVTRNMVREMKSKTKVPPGWSFYNINMSANKTERSTCPVGLRSESCTRDGHVRVPPWTPRDSEKHDDVMSAQLSRSHKYTKK